MLLGFIIGVVIAFPAGMLVMRNNYKRFQSETAQAQNDLAMAKTEVAQLKSRFIK